MGRNNCVGPFSVVGALGTPVVIGDSNYIGANCVIGSPAESVSEIPGSSLIALIDKTESLGDFPRRAGLAIGSMSVIRDSVTIHAGLENPTQVHDLVYIHSQSHIDHDSVVEVGAVVAPGVTTGGRVILGAFSQTGLDSALHQDTNVGAFSMIGMNSTLKGATKPFSLYFGSPSRFRGLNLIRLKRLGLESRAIDEIKELVGQELPFTDPARIDSVIRDLVAKSTVEALRIWTSQKR
jgi:UDP-N-acetylglucosamine acyltransferase